MSNQNSLEDSGWNLGSETEQLLLKKLRSAGVPLSEYVNGEIYYGIKTGLNEAFVIDEETKNRLIKEDKRSSEVIKPFLAGRDIKRYSESPKGRYLLFIPWHFPLHKDESISGASILAEKKFKDEFPSIYNHLLQFKKELQERNKAETGIRYEWYALQRCAATYYEEFDNPKIIIPAIVKDASYSFDSNKFYSNDKTSIIPTNDKYLLGLLNSKAIDFFLKSIAATKQGGYFEYKPMYVSKLPIKKIDEKNKFEKSLHDEIIQLVESMLQLQQQKQNTALPDQLNQLKQRIAYTDDKINENVYTLYGLTEEERKVVEGK